MKNIAFAKYDMGSGLCSHRDGSSFDGGFMVFYHERTGSIFSKMLRKNPDLAS